MYATLSTTFYKGYEINVFFEKMYYATTKPILRRLRYAGAALKIGYLVYPIYFTHVNDPQMTPHQPHDFAMKICAPLGLMTR